MCGIAGWNLKESPKESFVLSLMSEMESRGYQSFGYYDGDAVSILQDVGSITMHLPASSVKFKSGFIHTRHATTGNVVAENSHPFQIGDIIGAHNGMVYNHAEIKKKYNRSYQVDSQHIFAHIVDDLPLSELDGYGTIEYVRDGRYFVAKCNDGELQVARTSVGMIWASTRDAIEMACFQAGYILETFYTIESGKIYLVTTDNLYHTDSTFQMNEAKSKYQKTDWRQFGNSSGLSGTQSQSNLSRIRLQGKEIEFDTRTEWEKELDTEYEKRNILDKQNDGLVFVNGVDSNCAYCDTLGTCYPDEFGEMLCRECSIDLAEYHGISILESGTEDLTDSDTGSLLYQDAEIDFDIPGTNSKLERIK